MDALLTWLKALFVWFKAPVKIMSALAVLSAIGLFVPHNLQSLMGIDDWTAKYRVQEWMLFLFGVTWTAISGLQAGFHRASLWRQLQHLPKDQKEVLRFYVKENVSAHPWFVAQSGPRALQCEGLLFLLPKPPISPQNEPQLDGILHYRIKPWVLKYLRKRPKLVAE
jgi:hypothetical protein